MRLLELDGINDKRLEAALIGVADYIQHNQSCDHAAHAKVLREFGYVEPKHAMPVYRYLHHIPTESDFEQFKTLGEFCDHLKAEPRLVFGEPHRFQSFSTSHEKVTEIAYRVLWLLDSQPEHHDQVPLSNFKDAKGAHAEVLPIYCCSVPQEAILWSTEGLEKWLPGLNLADPFPKQKLIDSMDPFEGGYNDEEVMVDTNHGIEIMDVQLYNSQLTAHL